MAEGVSKRQIIDGTYDSAMQLGYSYFKTEIRNDSVSPDRSK